MNTLGERTKFVLKMKSIKIGDIAESIGKNRATVSSYIINRSYPNGEFFIALKRFIPDLNLNWLITGEGEMFSNTPSIEAVNKLKDQLAETQKREKQLTDTIIKMGSLIGTTEPSKYKAVRKPGNHIPFYQKWHKVNTVVRTVPFAN